MSTRSLRCLFAASEVAGFAKTGGLADVGASLPAALAERGLDVAVVMPLYRSARLAADPLEPTGLTFRTPIGHRSVEGVFWRSRLPGTEVPVFLLEQRDYYDRDDPSQGRGIYQYADPDRERIDYNDNCERFVFFCRGILELIALADLWPDVLHLNDWQTGLAPIYLREVYRKSSRPLLRPKYDAVRTLFTIHNLAYQGRFWHHDMPMVGLPWKLFTPEALEFYGEINFLKAGLIFADALTTVSPTYAREIQTPYYGCGLQGVLNHRRSSLTGIVNGIDAEVWNPAGDPHLAKNYDVQTAETGKAACKKDLQKELNLAQEPNTLLLGMVSRLASQKGFDLLQKIAPDLLRRGIQLAALGDGDSLYREFLQQLQEHHPGQVGVRVTQDEGLAHRIEAGVDAFLMPSQYEPCGLNQLYSLRYGALPIVRATGGLADTVTDATEANLAAGKATGFAFVTYAPEAFLEAIDRAHAMYTKNRTQWRAMQRTAMLQDWSWRRSAAEYEQLYRNLVATFR